MSKGKLKPVQRQPGINQYMTTPEQKRTTNPKLRTPPTIEENPSKRPTMQGGVDNDTSIRDITTKDITATPAPSTIPKDALDIKLENMKKRITESIITSMGKVIADALKPMEENIRKLTESNERNERNIKEVQDVKKLNDHLHIRCSRIEHENKVLKEHLNKIELKLLEKMSF